MPDISVSYGALTLTSRRQDNWGNWSEATADAVFSFDAIPAGAQVSTATLTIQVGQDPICGAYMTVDGQSVLTGMGTRSISITVPAGTASRTVHISYKGTGKSYSVSQVAITGMTLSLSYVVPMSSWTLTKTQATAGEEIGVTITPSITSAQHKVTYAFGSQTVTYALAAGIKTHSMTVPLDWCAQIPDATYGTGAVTVETMDSSGTVLGAESKPITITVPDRMVPTLTGLTVTGIDLKWGLYIQGISSVQAVASGAAGIQGSTIRSYAIAGGGYSAAAQALTTGTLSTSGTNTFRATVTDSRGRTSEAQTASIEVAAYSPAALTEVSVSRCVASGVEDDAGTCLRCVIGYSWTSVGENACLVRISARAAGTEAWTQLYEGTPESGTALVTGDGTILEGSSWEVLVQAADAISSTQVIRKVPTAHTFFLADPQNDSFAFGCYPEGEKRLRLAEDWALYIHGKEIATWMGEKAEHAHTHVMADVTDLTIPSAPTVTQKDYGGASFSKDASASVVLSNFTVSESSLYAVQWNIQMVTAMTGRSFAQFYGKRVSFVSGAAYPCVLLTAIGWFDAGTTYPLVLWAETGGVMQYENITRTTLKLT